jgi:hypothetical protein
VPHDDVALGHLARAVDHPRVDDHEGGSRRSIACAGAPVGERLGALVVVDPDSGRPIDAGRAADSSSTPPVQLLGGAQGDEAGDVDDPLDAAALLGCGEHVLEAAHVDPIELLRRGQDLDQRRGVDDGVASVRGRLETARSVTSPSTKSTPAREALARRARPHEQPQLVPRCELGGHPLRPRKPVPPVSRNFINLVLTAAMRSRLAAAHSSLERVVETAPAPPAEGLEPPGVAPAAAARRPGASAPGRARPPPRRRLDRHQPLERLADRHSLAAGDVVDPAGLAPFRPGGGGLGAVIDVHEVAPRRQVAHPQHRLVLARARWRRAGRRSWAGRSCARLPGAHQVERAGHHRAGERGPAARRPPWSGRRGCRRRHALLADRLLGLRHRRRRPRRSKRSPPAGGLPGRRQQVLGPQHVDPEVVAACASTTRRRATARRGGRSAPAAPPPSAPPPRRGRRGRADAARRRRSRRGSRRSRSRPPDGRHRAAAAPGAAQRNPRPR